VIIIYSQNIIFLYMFRASSAHLQEDIVVYMQLHVYNCILLKMSTWGSKHVQEN